MQKLMERKATASGARNIRRIMAGYKPDTIGKFEYVRRTSSESLRKHMDSVDNFFLFSNMYDHIEGSDRKKYAHVLDDMVCHAQHQVIVCCNRISTPLDSHINLFVIEEMLRNQQFFHFSLLTTLKDKLPEKLKRVLMYPNAFYGEIDPVHVRPYSFVIVDGHSLAAMLENEDELKYRIKFSFSGSMADRYRKKYEEMLKDSLKKRLD